jgi:hypothetical protein
MGKRRRKNIHSLLSYHRKECEKKYELNTFCFFIPHIQTKRKTIEKKILLTNFSKIKYYLSTNKRKKNVR